MRAWICIDTYKYDFIYDNIDKEHIAACTLVFKHNAGIFDVCLARSLLKFLRTPHKLWTKILGTFPVDGPAFTIGDHGNRSKWQKKPNIQLENEFRMIVAVATSQVQVENFLMFYKGLVCYKPLKQYSSKYFRKWWWPLNHGPSDLDLNPEFGDTLSAIVKNVSRDEEKQNSYGGHHLMNHFCQNLFGVGAGDTAKRSQKTRWEKLGSLIGSPFCWIRVTHTHTHISFIDHISNFFDFC